tara:strand:+ start:1037 stop:2332 length:1296 start_codon:yes stop_codon:yes gene_type:complete
MKYIIFGGGPCGMRLADELSDKGHEVHLHEKSNSLGGCWKIKWNDGYFMEHSCRVMTTNYKNVTSLVEELGLEDPYRDIYGSTFSSSIMFLSYFLRNLSFLDTLKFTKSMLFISKSDKRNFKEWMEDNNITTKGKKALRNLSITLATVPQDLSAYCMFDAIYGGFGKGKFIQFREGDKWLKMWEKKLRKKDNVKIYLNSKVNGFVANGKEISYANTSRGRIYGDRFICAVPLWSLKDIIKNSSNEIIKNNWMKSEDFTKYCEKLSYTGIGIQLHFSKKTGIEEKRWCQTCFGDWTIIIQKTSDYLDKFTKKKDIKEVWSCVLVDFTRKSKRLDKTPGKLNIDEIIEEVLYQLETTLGTKIRPKMTTANVDINRWGKWELIESAFASGPEGPLQMKGKKIKNLFAVGCQNRYEIAILDGALQSADDFCEKYG